MATTRYAQSVAGPLPKTLKFTVSADNDLLLDGDNYIVLGAFFEGLATAVNIDSGVDITELPAQVASTETLNVTASGAGAVTLVVVALPNAGYSTFDV